MLNVSLSADKTQISMKSVVLSDVKKTYSTFGSHDYYPISSSKKKKKKVTVVSLAMGI